MGEGGVVATTLTDPLATTGLPGTALLITMLMSLTQFYSVDFSQSRIGVNKCVFYKRTIKVCISC